VYDAAYGLNARVGMRLKVQEAWPPPSRQLGWRPRSQPLLCKLGGLRLARARGREPMGGRVAVLSICLYPHLYSPTIAEKTRFIVLQWHAFTATLYATSTIVEIIKTNQLLAITSGRFVR